MPVQKLTAIQTRRAITTEELAALLSILPQSIRKRYCETGSYYFTASGEAAEWSFDVARRCAGTTRRGSIMRNAHQPKLVSAGRHGNDIAGGLPVRVNTVTAGFLAALLEGKEITGMEAAFRQSTTRAAAWVYYLKTRYGWTIERREIADGTNDGRISWVVKYWLSDGSREAAFATGAREWMERVQAAASNRRSKAGEVKARAARINGVLSDAHLMN